VSDNPSVKDWLGSAERVTSRVCISCQDPWKSAIREVLEELAAGTAGPGVTLAGLHRFLQSDAFASPYPVGVSALRAHVRAHESELHATWVARGGKLAGA